LQAYYLLMILYWLTFWDHPVQRDIGIGSESPRRQCSHSK